MEIKIKSDLLLQGLEPLSIIIKENHIIPILDSVLIRFTKDGLFLTGNNSEISCTKKIDFNNEIVSNICVNYRLLSTILKNIDAQEITIILDDLLMKIFHSKGGFELPVFDGNDFPLMILNDMSGAATINGKQLKSSLRVANKFILNSELEPMSNVLISVNETNAIIRSTNKAALFQENINGKGDEKNILMSPVSSIGLSYLISDNDIEMKYSDSKVFINDNDTDIIIILQNGDFPVKMFQSIIDTIEGKENLKIDIEEFKTSLKRVSLLADSQHNNLVKFDINNTAIKISCDNKAFSTKSEEDIQCKFEGLKVVGFNSKLLIEILSVFDKDVELGFNTSSFLCFKNDNKMGILSNVLLNE